MRLIHLLDTLVRSEPCKTVRTFHWLVVTSFLNSSPLHSRGRHDDFKRTNPRASECSSHAVSAFCAARYERDSHLPASAGCQTVYSLHGLKHDCVRVVRNPETVEEAAETVLTSADAVRRGFEAIQSGQVLRLDVPKVVLNATLLITTSNVEVRGRPERTRMLCPSDGSALIIRFVTSGC